MLGLVLLGLTLYMSTLVYALRDYSRSQLSARVGENGQRPWLEWLEKNESELQLLTSCIRFALVLGVLTTVCAWYLPYPEVAASWVPFLVCGLITLLLMLIFAIAIPHGLAMHGGEVILAHSLRLLLVTHVVLWPLARGMLTAEFVIRRLLGKADRNDEAESERMEQEILDAVSEGEAHGAVHEDQKEIIESVFEFDETSVNAIMTPRTDMHAVQVNTTYGEIRDMIIQTGHSRIPVYEESVDHIVGVLYAKDLLQIDSGNSFDARQLMRDARYVPETKSISDLLNEFRQSKIQIAIVLDEYGGTAGLVTIEDILEELVGEIDDEYDNEEAPTINHIDADTLEVDARVHVDEINEKLGIKLPEEEDYETIGGFVFSTLGKIPAAGEEFTHAQVHFRVVDAEARKINRLRIHVTRQVEAG
ncbi:MAG: hemolysin family protein [Planctomycetota bacterium]